jgi:hypothetical protein
MTRQGLSSWVEIIIPTTSWPENIIDQFQITYIFFCAKTTVYQGRLTTLRLSVAVFPALPYALHLG